MSDSQDRHDPSAAKSLDEPRLIAAVQEYMAEVESGKRPERSEFLGRHSDIAKLLSNYLDALDFVHAGSPTLGDASSRDKREERVEQVHLDSATPLGDFRIVRELGRGGMGVVYEAEEMSLARRVALKVLPFAWTLDSRQLQRFKNEARAAAQLHHSHIVPIYSVGCERGVHFYAMQFIEGQTLAEVIRELRTFEKKAETTIDPSEHTQHLSKADLSSGRASAETIVETSPSGTAISRSGKQFFRDAARLGMQAAEALDHAHEYGVVHRDVKPGNLMIDHRGHLWVTDFGLAQFPSDGMVTATGDILGTLRYMSPEQALAKKGLVDHRTDIYSLGVTLYEYLTLEPVYDGRDREELLRQITFDEPKPPRKRNPAIPIDLETIVLKAMAKNLEDRYVSARELADDLQRFIDQKPIRARRPPWPELVARWARRHWNLVAASFVFFALLAVGSAVGTALVARSYQAEALQRKRAEESLLQARDTVDQFTAMSEVELGGRPELQGLRSRFLETSLAYYRKFVEQSKDDPSLNAELIETQMRVAAILDEIGSRSESVEAYELAKSMLHRLSRQGPAGANSEMHRGFGPFEGPSPWRRNGDFLRLVENSAVRAEIMLTPEQGKQVDDLSTRQRDTFRNIHFLSSEGRKAAFEEVAELSNSVIKILNAEQITRLKQISWQQRGAFALIDPEVADRLALSQEQRDRIKGIREAAWSAVTHHHIGRSSSDDKARRSTEDQWRKTRLHMEEVLTPEQTAAWSELRGEPFDFPTPPPRSRDSDRSSPGPQRDPFTGPSANAG